MAITIVLLLMLRNPSQQRFWETGRSIWNGPLLKVQIEFGQVCEVCELMETFAKFSSTISKIKSLSESQKNDCRIVPLVPCSLFLLEHAPLPPVIEQQQRMAEVDRGQRQPSNYKEV